MKHLDEHKFYGVKPELLSLDFIAGLIVGEGTFYWDKHKSNKYIIPVFALRFHIRDFDLLINVKYSLGLSERVYEYTHGGRHYAFLIVRSFDGLKRIIENIYPRLTGYKKEQFSKWFHRFNDKDIKKINGSLYEIFRSKFPELY